MRLAQLLKPREPLAAIIRALLARYGALGKVGAALAANFCSGSWWGSYADRERERRQTATGWLADPDPEVRKWAAEIIDGIDRELPALELLDIEEDRL